MRVPLVAMANVNVYLPTELHAALKAMALSPSQLLQDAIKAELARRGRTNPRPLPPMTGAFKPASQLGYPAGDLLRRAERDRQRQAACPHERKRTGDSGLRFCDDCGKVNP